MNAKLEKYFQQYREEHRIARDTAYMFLMDVLFTHNTPSKWNEFLIRRQAQQEQGKVLASIEMMRDFINGKVLGKHL